MKRIGLLVAIFGVAFLLIGCPGKTRVADLTVMASKNISTLEGAKEMGTFEGKDCKSMFGGTMPSQEEALDQAVEAGGGNAMVDAVIYFKPAVCLFDTNCWEVKGKVIKTKDMFGQDKMMEENDQMVDSQYTKEVLSINGKKYMALKKKGTVELDNDTQHYDLVVRIE